VTSHDNSQGAARLRDILADRTLRWLLGRRRAVGRDPLAGATAVLDDRLDPAGRAIYRVFVAGESVPADAFVEAVGGAVASLLDDHALLRREGAAVRHSGLMLNELFGAVFFSGINEVTGTYVHFGEDTVRFLETLMAQPRTGRGLVLCTGHGGDAVALTARCATVDAVEWMPEVARIARLNVALSGEAEAVTVHAGDLYEPVGDGCYDLIVANPPFSPSLDDPADDPAAVGGADGLDVARRIWDGGIGRLREGGLLAQFLGFLGDARAPFVVDELERLAARYGVAFTLLPVAAPQPIDRLAIPTRQAEPIDRRKAQIAAGAARTGATHYHVGAALMTRAERPGVTVAENGGSAARSLAQTLRHYKALRASA